MTTFFCRRVYILSHSDVLYIGRATHYCQYKHFVNLKIDHGGQANTAYIILWHHNIHVKLFRSWCITLGGSQCTRYQKLWAPFQHQYDDVHLNCSDSDISIIKSIYTNHKISQWHLGVHDLTSKRKQKYFCILEIKMDHITKVDQNHRFFLRIFFPTHFDHWKPKYGSWQCCILWNLSMCLHKKSCSTFLWCRTHLLNISF